MFRGASALALYARRRWLTATAAAVGVLHVALASRSIEPPAEFSLAIAFGWACALFLLQDVSERAASRAWIAAGVLLIAVSLLELGQVQYQGAHRLAALCAGVGVVLLAGPQQLRRQAPALAMLLFPTVLPAPRIARELLDLSPWTASAAAMCLRIGGESNVQDGVFLRMPHAVVVVADGCSGLSQIFALLVLALFTMALFPTTRGQKILLLASAAFVGFACNAVRIAALAVLAERDEIVRFDAWHDGALAPLCTVAATLVALAIWLPMLLRGGPSPQASPR